MICNKTGNCFVFQTYQQAVAPIQGQVDNVNDHVNDFEAANVVLSHVIVHKLEDYKTR
jgi:hypothetical protein